MPESGMSRYRMFFYNVYIYKTQIKSMHYYLKNNYPRRAVFLQILPCKNKCILGKRKKNQAQEQNQKHWLLCCESTQRWVVPCAAEGAQPGLYPLSWKDVLSSAMWTKGRMLQPQRSSPLTKLIIFLKQTDVHSYPKKIPTLF